MQDRLTALAHCHALERQLASMLDEINAELEPHEVLDFIAVVGEQWTIDNGFLTPTLKIRRDVIEARYEPQLEAWASRRRKIVWA